MYPIHVGSEVTKSVRLDHGHIPVGTAAAQLLATKFNFRYGVTLYASSSNAANIWIGRSGVTANTNAITGGFPLVPGSSITLPVAEMQHIYAISTSASQDLAWLGI